MNPFGLRPAHVRSARVAAKTRRFPYPGAAIRPHRPISTHDCEHSFGYAKFTPIAAGDYTCAMQHHEFLFIFQKGIRAGIEYRV
jgi:hypothetical protein